MKNAVLKGLLLFICFSAASNLLPAQDLTGIWRGHFSSNGLFERTAGSDDRYRMEVQIAQTKGTLEAVTYSYKSTEFYGKATADGSVDKVKNTVLLKELKLVELRSFGFGACVMTCHFTYSRLGNEEFLQGTYSSASTQTGGDSGCGNGSIYLHKVASTDFYKEPFLEEKEKELSAKAKKPSAPEKMPPPKPILPPPVIAKPDVAINKNRVIKKAPPKAAPPKQSNPTGIAKQSPVFPETDRRIVTADSLHVEHHAAPAMIPAQLLNRSNDLVKTMTVTSQDIIVSIYDDGAIDNDSVTVYFDNKRILSRARLTDQAINLKVHIEPSDKPHELVLVAENLGDIPPNTSLMVVRDGDKSQEVRIVTNEQKNAMLKISYRKVE